MSQIKRILTNDITELQRLANQIAHEKGWYEDGPRNVGEVIALMHSELSEALEEWRDGKPDVYHVLGKPEGLAIELADCVIRIMDTCTERGIDLGACIRMKMTYNRTRPHRHGNKRA